MYNVTFISTAKDSLLKSAQQRIFVIRKDCYERCSEPQLAKKGIENPDVSIEYKLLESDVGLVCRMPCATRIRF